MGNEKGRKRLDSIKDIFREKGSQKWTFPFQFQFCHKVFQVHISELCNNVSIQCIQTHKKSESNFF